MYIILHEAISIGWCISTTILTLTLDTHYMHHRYNTHHIHHTHRHHRYHTHLNTILYTTHTPLTPLTPLIVHTTCNTNTCILHALYTPHKPHTQHTPYTFYKRIIDNIPEPHHIQSISVIHEIVLSKMRKYKQIRKWPMTYNLNYLI